MSRFRPSSYSRTLALVPPVFALASQQADAGLFLRVENTNGSTVSGESLDKNHPAWIEVGSIQFGVTNAITLGAGGITPTKGIAKDLVVSKQLDKASPLLFLGCAQGILYAKVTLELTTFNGATGTDSVYYRITLNNVMISKMDSSGSTDRPSESVSMSYERITTEYFQQDAKGNFPTTPTTSSVWSFATNTSK